MSRIIIFDFNRTLYDPATQTLTSGARELLKDCRAAGYQLILIAKISQDRADLLRELGIDVLFDKICLVNDKNFLLFDLVVREYTLAIEVGQSWVIGDRAQSELWYGYQRGLLTIWYRSGKFADEMPFETDYPYPTHTVSDLDQISDLIGGR